MLLNTQTVSKRAFKGHLRPKKHSATTHRLPIQESEDLDVMDLYEIEREKNMWAARYMAVGEAMIAALLILSLIWGYMCNGHVRGEVIRSVFIASTSLTVSAAYLWHLTRGFFSELKKNRTARK